MAARDLSQQDVATAAGVQRQEIGRALRHADALAGRGRTASATTWQRVEGYLQPQEDTHA